MFIFTQFSYKAHIYASTYTTVTSGVSEDVNDCIYTTVKHKPNELYFTHGVVWTLFPIKAITLEILGKG